MASVFSESHPSIVVNSILLNVVSGPPCVTISSSNFVNKVLCPGEIRRVLSLVPSGRSIS